MSAAQGPGRSGLGWGGIVRLGLVQTALGAVVLVVTSTINRVMVVELALPALVPGLLVALHYAIQMLRPRLGHGSDLGGRRTPWIIGGMAALAAGGVVAALAVMLMADHLVAGIALAVLGFSLVGLGVGASGTSLLLLLARQVAAPRRPAAATIVWLMMLAGFAGTAGFISWQLHPYSAVKLVELTAIVGAAAVLLTIASVWRIEVTQSAPVAPSARPAFRAALAQVWSEPEARRFTVFVFLSMFAYSAQELILEPFAGMVFARTPGQSAGLAGILHGGVFAGMLAAAVLGTAFARNGAVRADQMRGWAVGGCIASGVAMSGLVAASLVGPGWPLAWNVGALGFANGCFVTAAISSMMALAGRGQSGREGVRMGLWGAAQAIAFALGGLSGSAASDIARHVLGQPEAAYGAVFTLEALLFLAAARQAALVFGSSDQDRATAAAPHGAVARTGR